MLSLHTRRGGVNIAVQTHEEGETEGEACVKLPVTFVAAELVTEVGAVVSPVTLESAGNTGAVETLELIMSASRTTWNSKEKQI